MHVARHDNVKHYQSHECGDWSTIEIKTESVPFGLWIFWFKSNLQCTLRDWQFLNKLTSLKNWTVCHSHVIACFERINGFCFHPCSLLCIDFEWTANIRARKSVYHLTQRRQPRTEKMKMNRSHSISAANELIQTESKFSAKIDWTKKKKKNTAEERSSRKVFSFYISHAHTFAHSLAADSLHILCQTHRRMRGEKHFYNISSNLFGKFIRI